MPVRRILFLGGGEDVLRFAEHFQQDHRYNYLQHELIWLIGWTALIEIIDLIDVIVISCFSSSYCPWEDYIKECNLPLTGKIVLAYSSRGTWDKVYQFLRKIIPDSPEDNAFGKNDPNQRGMHPKDVINRIFNLIN